MKYYDYVKANEYEYLLIKTIMSLRKKSGVLIGSCSFRKLVSFIRGYEYVIVNNKKKNIKFEEVFRLFIEKRAGERIGRNSSWIDIVQKGKTDREAYFVFFTYYLDFLDEEGFRFEDLKTSDVDIV